MPEAKKAVTIRLDTATEEMVTEMSNLYDINRSAVIRAAIQDKYQGKPIRADTAVSSRIKAKLKFWLYLLGQLRKDAPEDKRELIDTIVKELVRSGR